jgi:tryptophan synthase alpha chain
VTGRKTPAPVHLFTHCRISVMNPIDTTFQRLRQRGQKAFIPFITAGDPNLSATAALAKTLAKNGASLLEIGFPYSDPLADGPIIQASYTRALERGLRLDDIFTMVSKLQLDIPLAAMVSYSLIRRKGDAAFIERAQQSGFSGAIVPDLPFDESTELERIAAKNDFKLIQLVTPTTPRDRAAAIAKRSTGFLYCVSVTGITGERARLPDEVLAQLAFLRQQTKLPLCVGFGISRPEHVAMLRDAADGIIVGSALVQQLENADKRPLAEVLAAVGGLASSLAAALNPTA